jgi:muconolactone delta-isomerase
MLFMYIHTHPLEKCVADKPEEMKKMVSKAQEETKKAGIKIIGNYAAPHEHTTYVIFDAPDVVTLEKLLIPMTLWGTARLIPIVSVEQALAMIK